MIKKIALITLVTLISLEARENPFMPTQAYLEERAAIVESGVELSRDYPHELQEKNSSAQNKSSVDDTPITESNAEEKKEDTKAQNPKTAQAKKKDKTATKQETSLDAMDGVSTFTLKQTTSKQGDKKKQHVQKSKVIKTITQGEYSLLPFLTLVHLQQEVHLKTEYEVFRKFEILASNKIVIDFRGKTRFYTKRIFFDSENFKNITVGNHRLKNFFRVVIQTYDTPNNYEATYLDGSIIVRKKK